MHKRHGWPSTPTPRAASSWFLPAPALCSPSGEKQIKVYEPLSSQELRAVVDVCPPAPSASQGPKGSALEAWVTAHLEQLALSTSWGTKATTGTQGLQPITEKPLAA